jgi:hypothetical protein
VGLSRPAGGSHHVGLVRLGLRRRAQPAQRHDVQRDHQWYGDGGDQDQRQQSQRLGSRGDLERPERPQAGQESDSQRHDQIHDAEHMEARHSPSITASQPTGDDWRGQPDRDVAQARRQGEHARQVTQRHHDEECDSSDPPSVRNREPCDGLGVGEDAGQQRNTRRQQHQDEETGERHHEPWPVQSRFPCVDPGPSQQTAGHQPTAQQGRCRDSDGYARPAAEPGSDGAEIQHQRGGRQDPNHRGEHERPYVAWQVIHGELLTCG